MSNHITVADFRANYDHYMERMEAGESFCITDMEENKDKLMIHWMITEVYP